MEKITTYNYEAFYLDYLEGNLSNEEQDMLFKFLNQHPDLKTELELDTDVLDFKLSPDFKNTLKHIEKEELKHCDEDEICLKNVDDYIISDVEQQLSLSKKQALDEFVKTHQLEGRVKAYQATKLQPNLTEVYPNKNELKHQTKVIPLLIRITAVAALFLLLFNIIDFNQTNNKQYQQRQAKYHWQQPDVDTNSFDQNQIIDNDIQNHPIANNNERVTQKEMPKNQHNINTQNDLQQKINDVAEQSPQNNKINIDTSTIHRDEHPNLPIEKDNQPNEDNIANANTNSSKEKNSNIKLVDMYKPVTQVANNYTSLNVMAKKSTPESEYQVTKISVGKFSFERKKKR